MQFYNRVRKKKGRYKKLAYLLGFEYILDTDYTNYTVVFIYCNSVIRT